MTPEEFEQRRRVLKDYADRMVVQAITWFPDPDDSYNPFSADPPTTIPDRMAIAQGFVDWFLSKDSEDVPVEHLLADDAFQRERQAKAQELVDRGFLAKTEDLDPIRTLARDAGIIEESA